MYIYPGLCSYIDINPIHTRPMFTSITHISRLRLLCRHYQCTPEPVYNTCYHQPHPVWFDGKVSCCLFCLHCIYWDIEVVGGGQTVRGDQIIALPHHFGDCPKDSDSMLAFGVFESTPSPTYAVRVNHSRVDFVESCLIQDWIGN